MKFSCTLKNALPIIRNRFGLSFATKGLATLLHITYCYHHMLITNYLAIQLSVTYNFSTRRNTMLKTTCHFLLLLVGFATLTYRKDYDRSPILVGHQDSFLAPIPGSEAPLVGGIW